MSSNLPGSRRVHPDYVACASKQGSDTCTGCGRLTEGNKDSSDNGAGPPCPGKNMTVAIELKNDGSNEARQQDALSQQENPFIGEHCL